jgi:hypothetical protein
VNVVLGQALRWRVKPAAQLDDVLRVIDAGERLLLVLAAAYETGWSTCWAVGSRLLLDLFEESWRAHGAVETAFAAAAAAFPARATPLIEPDELAGAPAASLLVADVGPTDVTITWLGEHRALRIRNGDTDEVAPSHTVRNRFAGTQAAQVNPAVAHVLVGTIGVGDATQETRRADLRAGDALLLLGGAAARLDADLAGRNADAIVERAMGTREPQPSHAVALLAYIG